MESGLKLAFFLFCLIGFEKNWHQTTLIRNPWHYTMLVVVVVVGDGFLCRFCNNNN